VEVEVELGRGVCLTGRTKACALVTEAAAAASARREEATTTRCLILDEDEVEEKEEEEDSELELVDGMVVLGLSLSGPRKAVTVVLSNGMGQEGGGTSGRPSCCCCL
jgi:hypothetical protein